MDKSYMLNSYVNDKDISVKELEQANQNLDKYNLRTTGVKSIEELKQEVAIFLEKNVVPIELEEELMKICNSFNENTNLYQASANLDDILKKYQVEKEKISQGKNEQVNEIKIDLVNQVKSDLDRVDIALEGNIETSIDNINDESDVYKLKNNADRVVNHYQNKEIMDDSPTIVLSMDDINNAVDKPTSETLLNEAINQEMNYNNITDSNINMKDDGSITIEGNANNPESMNFIAMMTLALAVGNNDLNLGENRDIKLSKEIRETNNYQVLFGYYSKQNNKYDSALLQRVQQLAQTYKPSISYIDALSHYSTEMFLTFQIVNNYILKQPGAFKLAIKNNDGNYNMKFGFGKEYQDIVDTFIENGAYMTEDMNHDSIFIINDNGNKEQLLQLGQILDGLQTKGKEEKQIQALENQYQKKLIVPLNNNVANANQIFLITVLVTDILLVLIGICFIFF